MKPLPRRSFLTGLLALPAALLPFKAEAKTTTVMDLAPALVMTAGSTYYLASDGRFYIVTGTHVVEWSEISNYPAEFSQTYS